MSPTGVYEREPRLTTAKSSYLTPNVGEPLSRRQREVVALVAQGLTNSEIAERLFISAKTVEALGLLARRKAGVRNRVELAVWWLQELNLGKEQSHE